MSEWKSQKPSGDRGGKRSNERPNRSGYRGGGNRSRDENSRGYGRDYNRGGNDDGGFNKRERFMRKSRDSVMQALKSRDMLLASVTKSIEDLDKTINLLGERLEDWYSLYFPELKTDEKIKFCNAILIIDRDNFDENALSAILGQKHALELAQSSKTSLGTKLSSKDLSECLLLAKSILSLETLRKDYENYQKELAHELCPNLSEVGGPEIAAKLVSHVGSLVRLAMLPASAIQVLGAEKALFKHLKNRRIPPPKHGIIFQYARISSSPKSVRGKIARALANKLSIAAKADAFTKNPIFADLKKDLETRLSEIMVDYERQKKAKVTPPA